MEDDPILDDTVVDRALAHVRGAAFRLADLEALMAPLPRSKGTLKALLEGVPQKLPLLLRSAIGRSAERGAEDTFGFLHPLERARITRSYRRGDGELFVFSDAGARSGAYWSLETAAATDPDPLVRWSSPGSAEGTTEARLSTWVQIHAVETFVVKQAEREHACVGRAQEERIVRAIADACAEVTPAEGPWLTALRARVR